MIKPLNHKYAPGWVCVFLMLMAVSGIAQTKISVKQTQTTKTKITVKKTAATKTSTKPKAKANKVAIISHTVSFEQLHPHFSADSFVYINPQLPIIVSGKTPKNDVQVKLILENKSSATVQFSSAAGFSTTTNLDVDKSSFVSSGKPQAVMSQQIGIRFKAAAYPTGNIYISIAGQPAYYCISFNHYQILVDTLIDTVKVPVTSTSKPLLRPGISIVKNTTNVQLDSAAAQLVNDTLQINLSPGSWKNDSIYVTPSPMISSGIVQVVNADKSIPIGIDRYEWNYYKSVHLKRAIKFYILQPSLATDTQYIVVTGKGINGYHTIKLIPFKSKVKKVLGAGPLAMGQAELVEQNRIGISHTYGTNVSTINPIQLKVKIYGNYKKENSILTFTFIDTSVSKHFKIIPNPDTITQSEWEMAKIEYKKEFPKDTANKKDTIGILNIPLKVKTTALNDSLSTTPYIDIVLKGQGHINGGSQKVKISAKDKPFWAEVGTNFDVLDKIKTNNLYAGVYMFDKDVARIGWFHRSDSSQNNRNLSFTGGVYESQSISTSSTLSSGIYYRNLDSVYRSTGATSATTSVKSIGILFSPHLKLTNGKTDEDGLHVFASFYDELLWQTVSSTFAYPKDSVAQKTTALSSYPFKEASVNYDFRSHYLGLGLPIYIKEADYNLYINSVIGGTNQKFYVSNDNITSSNYTSDPSKSNYIEALTFRNPKSNWNSFYLFQYRLNEVKYGITFSGEIRGLLLNNSKPVITLALSKKFDLSALLKPLVAPF